MKQDDPAASTGSFLLIVGAMAFFPPLFDFEFLLSAWLGPMQQPVGLSAMVVGGALFGFGKLRELRHPAPVISPTDPAAIAAVDAEALGEAADGAPTPRPSAEAAERQGA